MKILETPIRRLAVVLAVIPVFAILAANAVGDISQSHHDFSGAGWSQGEICRPCHTPHHADTTVLDSPLWNHEHTNATFTPYSSSTLDALPGQPSGVTKLCLSCHDGTVAIDSFGGNTGSRMILPNYQVGPDLTSHHPMSFVYDTGLAAADGELHDPTSAPSGLGGTIDQDLLSNGRLECTSCHDVHISRNTSGCTGCHFVHGMTTKTLSLWKDNTGSALCLTCHKK